MISSPGSYRWSKQDETAGFGNYCEIKKKIMKEFVQGDALRDLREKL